MTFSKLDFQKLEDETEIDHLFKYVIQQKIYDDDNCLSRIAMSLNY